MSDSYSGNRQPRGQDHGQGYRHPDPKIGGSRHTERSRPRRHSTYARDSYPAPPNAPASEQYDASYFPPPPRSEYTTDNTAGAERSYAPSESHNNDAQALTPYEEEKAYAQYTEAYGLPDYGEQRPQPVPPASDSDRPAADRRYQDRPNDGRRYDDRRLDDRRYDDRPRYDERPRRRHSRPSRDESLTSRRYDSRGPSSHHDDRRMRKPRSPPKTGKDMLRQGDGERGIGATLLGGAAGALLGQEVGKRGALGTLGGALVGAIGATALDKQYEKRKEGKDGSKEDKNRMARRSYQYEYAAGGQDPYYGARGPPRGEELEREPSKDHFRPKRVDLRTEPPRRRRREQSEDTYLSAR